MGQKKKKNLTTFHCFVSIFFALDNKYKDIIIFFCTKFNDVVI